MMEDGRETVKIWGLKGLLAYCCIFISFCSTSYSIYSKNLFYGKEFLKAGKIEDARKCFLEAWMHGKDSTSLTYLAIAEYKMGRVDKAREYLENAMAVSKEDFTHLRRLGYKALILLKQDKNEGIDALKAYVKYYENMYPLMSIYDLKRKIDKEEFEDLETLIESQISWYESEIELFLTSGVGFYDRKVERGEYRIRK